MKQYILMADVIGSSAKAQETLLSNFKSTVEAINSEFDKDLTSPLTITLGDEFQGLVKDLEGGLTIIVALEEFIMAHNFQFKLRYVLFYGKVETEINPDIAHGMMGHGLTESRKALDRLKGENDRFFVEIPNESLKLILNHTFAIYQDLVDNWNLDRDFKLISSFIDHRDYKRVAEDLDKNRSLMWKREKSLHISSYFSLKKILNVSTDFI